MANTAEIQEHYDTLGPLHALRLEGVHGGYPDYTCALFDGDFTKSLDQAQKDKHTWIFDNLGLGQDLSGKYLLDIGCGWGPILNAVRERGGKATGLTLSLNQVEQCTRGGLDARLQNYKDLYLQKPEMFDGIISIGAFEHFCSKEEMQAGKQEEVYRKFFKICADRLPVGGRLFLQTMTWGKSVPDSSKLSLDAPKDSPEAMLARVEYIFPGSWLPNGLEQMVECAKEHFNFISSKNGRLDYIETFKRWSDSTRNLWSPKLLPRAIGPGMRLAYRVLTNRAARIQWESIQRGDMSACFKQNIMSHERMFFEKK